MRKIIIFLIITLTTFMGGNIYTNNEQRLSENVTKNSEDNTIISEENTIISESFDDNFQKISENLEIEKELNISNDKESEGIAPEESNVTVTLYNATEEKRKEKITKEEKRIEETKEEKIEISQQFEELKVFELVNKIKTISKAYNVRIDDRTAQYLIECVGTNMQDIINEIRKLIEYAGNGGTISKNDIDALTVKKTESVIFDLTDSLGKRDINKAIEVLHNLIDTKEPLQLILIMLYRHFKKLHIIHICKGKDVAIHLKLKPNQIFLIKKYTSQANYFKIDELENILTELIYLDEASKNGNIDLNIGIETVLCRYCS